MEAVIAQWLAAGNFDLLIFTAVYYLPGNDCFTAQDNAAVITLAGQLFAALFIMFSALSCFHSAWNTLLPTVVRTRYLALAASPITPSAPAIYTGLCPAAGRSVQLATVASFCSAASRNGMVKLFYCVFSPGSPAAHRFFNVLPTIFLTCVTTFPLKQLINLLSL